MFARIKTSLHTVLAHRMAPALWISLALFAVIACLAPKLLPISLYKLALITAGAWVAYWLDRWFFPYARPDSFLDQPWNLGAPLIQKVLPLNPDQVQAFNAAQIRRAIIVGAAMIAMALGA